MALGGGPTQMRPSPTTRSAKSASSDMKPYPGWTWGAGGHSSQPPHMGGVLVCVCGRGGWGEQGGRECCTRQRLRLLHDCTNGSDPQLMGHTATSLRKQVKAACSWLGAGCPAPVTHRLSTTCLGCSDDGVCVVVRLQALSRTLEHTRCEAASARCTNAALLIPRPRSNQGLSG
jgi:hypothetical protein